MINTLVNSMGTEERDDSYWIGVRDALRMIDSFIRWARRHPNEAKPIEEFIAEGIEAAARRCESCLKRSLGLSFKRKGDTSEPPAEPAIPGPEMPLETLEEASELAQAKSSETGWEPTEEPSTIDEPPEPEPSFEVSQTPPDAKEPSAQVEDEHVLDSEVPPQRSEDEGTPTQEPSESEVLEGPPIFIEDEEIPEIGLDSEHRLKELDELTDETQARDFQSEFEIEEPHHLDVSSPQPSAEEADVSTSSETSVSDEETPETHEPEAQEEAESSGFTWTEYEDMVTPHEESVSTEEATPPDGESTIPIPPPPEVQPTETQESDEEHTEVWSPYDESEAHIEEPKDDDDVEHIDAIEESVPAPLEESHSETSPPPPPPPPEPDETDEERKRRARLLFFGSES